MPPSVWHREHPGLFGQHIQGLRRFHTVLLAMHLLNKHSYDPNKVYKKKSLTLKHMEGRNHQLSLTSRVTSPSKRTTESTTPNAAVDALQAHGISSFSSADVTLRQGTPSKSIIPAAKPLNWMTATLFCAVGYLYVCYCLPN